MKILIGPGMVPEEYEGKFSRTYLCFLEFGNKLK